LTPEKFGTLLLYPAPSFGGFTMINLARKLVQAETDVDKEEFVRGLIGATPEKGRKATAVGFVAGYLLSSKIRKK
jgi:hypothetical protein